MPADVHPSSCEPCLEGDAADDKLDLVEQLGSVNKKSKGSPKLKIRGAGSLTDQCPAGHADI